MKRKTLYAVFLVLVPLAVLELGSYAMLQAFFGGPKQVRERRQALVTVDFNQSGLIAAGRTKQYQYILHPYLGFVYDRTYNAAVGPLGFVGDDILTHVAPEEYNVVVTGGSVAANFFVLTAMDFKKRLAAVPELAGKKINMACVAIAGYKQPQQLLAVNYLLSLGARIDLLVNIDGFNEITLPFNDNYPSGVFVFYPTMWKDLTDDLGDSRRRTLVGELSLTDWARTTLAGWFSSAVLDRSMIADLAWVLADDILNGKAKKILHELERSTGTLAAFQTGPPNQGDQGAIQDRLADNWAESSRLMHDLARSGRFAYVHVLQPNQYVPGSKPLSENEEKTAITRTPGVAETTAQGYGRLARRIPGLEQAGVHVLDATMIFENVREDLYFDTCCHFNARGNAILLDAVMAFLSEKVFAASPHAR